VVVASDGLRSVVRNLVENAAEHDDSDGLSVRVTIESGDGRVPRPATARCRAVSCRSYTVVIRN